ncbi:hypothetical protein TNCV_4916891 [Trichonephila clavipes]|nr:hypothetical protein TNCV_4916891 [Trichonephila clavipes]
MIADELQINRKSARHIVTENLVMRKTRVIDIDDFPNIQRNVMTLLNCNPKEDSGILPRTCIADLSDA